LRGNVTVTPPLDGVQKLILTVAKQSAGYFKFK